MTDVEEVGTQTFLQRVAATLVTYQVPKAFQLFYKTFLCSQVFQNAVLIFCQAWNVLVEQLEAFKLRDGLPKSGQELFQTNTARTEDALCEILKDVAKFLNHGIHNERAASALKTWECLADASRYAPLLRSIYGLRERLSADQNKYQMQAAIDPDCILEAARRIVDPAETGLFPGQTKQAMRIIANCCGDNNTNRALMIGRSGVEQLKLLAGKKEELNILIPTIYNLCGEYDTAVTGVDGANLKVDMMDGADETQDTVPLTVAEYELGAFINKLDKTPIEMFLDLTYYIDPSLLPVLGDIVEIASRPVLFDIKHIIDTSDADIAQARLINLFQALTLNGPYFLHDQDAWASICQTYFNLLANPVPRIILSRSLSDLQAFINLAYKTQKPSTQGDLLRTAVLKLTYLMSALPTYAEDAAPDSRFISDLAQSLKDRHPQLLTTLALLSNYLTTLERITSFQKLYQVQTPLVEILTAHNDSLTLLPALSLCIRLTLVPECQVSLHSANIFSALIHLLEASPQREHNLEIHRESIALTRLVVKSQSEHVHDLLTKQTKLLTIILTIANTTIDTTSKLEAGRFIVELLRTLLSRNDVKTLASTAQEHTPTFPTSSIPSAITAVLILITDAPSSAIRAEGLFGLCLFSALSTDNSQSALMDTLASNQTGLMPILKEIVETSTSPDPQDGTTDASAEPNINSLSDDGDDETLGRMSNESLALSKEPEIADGNSHTAAAASVSDTGGRQAELANLRFLLVQLLPLMQDDAAKDEERERLKERDSFDKEMRDLAVKMGLSMD